MKESDLKLTIDYGAVNLKSLIITSDKEHFERKKAQGNIGVLLEPEVLKELNVDQTTIFYVIGILADK